MSQDQSALSLPELLSSIHTTETGSTVTISDNWLQGRAVYGGLSAALCLQAVLDAYDDLPPLRSAQLSFIGPGGRDLKLEPRVLRWGKSTAFIDVEMTTHAGERTARALFCFGAARDSNLSHLALPAPPVAEPDECGRFFEDAQGHNRGPNFAGNFNSRRADGALPMSASDAPDFTVWMQHREADVDPVVVGLVALADALPPAAMACFDGPAPVSTVTWQFDVLTPMPTTRESWWLCRSSAESIADGYSSQSMTIWNADRQPILTGRQLVAVFQ